jgi:hypothetical protein
VLFPIEQALSQRVQGVNPPAAERVRVTRSVFFQAVRRNHQRTMLRKKDTVFTDKKIGCFYAFKYSSKEMEERQP